MPLSEPTVIAMIAYITHYYTVRFTLGVSGTLEIHDHILITSNSPRNQSGEHHA